MFRTSIGVGALLVAAAACGGSEEKETGKDPQQELPYCERALDDRKAAVCQAWNCAREAEVAPAWTGDAASCEPGDDPDVRAASVVLTNAYRFVAGLEPVEADPALDEKAQQCAVLMHANRSLSHEPPESWACFDPVARQAASNSNIATADGYEAVHLYMADSGASNSRSLGHRRWILSPPLEQIGVGTTDQFSCMWVVHPFEVDEAPFVAWPPPGKVPVEMIHGATPWSGNVDSIGWSIQSNRIDLAGVGVVVREDGVERPVTLHPLLARYGSRYALRIVPDGWGTTVGRTYSVEVTGASEPISYSFELVDCAMRRVAP
ncbi:CAP domain-containing protein [Vulgatibacter sp.]|uniref:CAP domain-containing protein n=1 Tax=Vulgatibacter sp. TaxID=1971226 RepID=UPI0035693513